MRKPGELQFTRSGSWTWVSNWTTFLLCPGRSIFLPFFLKIFGSATWHVGFKFPSQGSNPHPLPWKHTVLTTGLPGKIPTYFFFKHSICFLNSHSPYHFSHFVVQLLSRVWLCDPMDCSTPRFPALRYLLEFAHAHFMESVMLSNHLILCCPLSFPFL